MADTPPSSPRRRGPAPVPTFDLYEEQRARPILEPVHVELVVTRSSRHDWKIRPHRHRSLLQVFSLRKGGGVLLEEQGQRALAGPVAAIVPPGIVHGFGFTPGTDGHVVTLADSFLAQCRRLAGGPVAPTALTLLPLEEGSLLAAEIDSGIARLERAFREMGPERPAALAGHALLLLALLQKGAEERLPARAGQAQTALVRRFREAVAQHYQEHWTLAEYGRHLGTTPSTLTRACRATAGLSPLEIVQERLLAEAQRMLVHGTRNVSGVAYALGFEPAYFSRFFTRRMGLSPLAYQRLHAETRVA